MSFKLINCPACNSRIKLEDLETGSFQCTSCGHLGTYSLDEKEINALESSSSGMQGLSYTVDIVMVIDATSSMKHLIDQVKNNALRFYNDLKGVMEAKSKSIDQLRVKAITFRDFWADGDKALISSRFFSLPADQAEFADWIGRIRAVGGGDLPENGLEALAAAIGSEWTSFGDKKRHIIVLWTDASTHSLEKGRSEKPRYYPANMPKDLNDLTDLWEDNPALTPSNKRLILYAPDKPAWSDISTHWSNTIQYPSTAGFGLSNLDYNTILDAIANSV